MDARIGMLNNGQYYAYVNGHSQEPLFGTLEVIECALGLRPTPTPVVAPVAPVAKPKGKRWNVTLRFQFPAWDEKDGITYSDIMADTKSEANGIVRRMAFNDGHTIYRGRYYFTAEEAK